jgi:nucleoside-diphosphate-sugar epimerase
MKKAVVAGGLGVIGRNLVEHLARLDDWEVVGPSRRSPDFCSRAQFIWVDLLDRADCERKLANLTDVTHLFSRRTKTAPLQLEQVGPNLAMLRNLVDVLEQRAASVERIVLFQGAKAYGVHLGPFKTPAIETDPRHMPPNFYYDQEDFLRSRRTAWTVLRPDVVCGFAIGNPMNLAMVMAVYA